MKADCWLRVRPGTDRAIAILHALTGSIDVPDGNVQFAQLPVKDVSGVEFRDPEHWRKVLGMMEWPLRPAVEFLATGRCCRVLPCEPIAFPADDVGLVGVDPVGVGAPHDVHLQIVTAQGIGAKVADATLHHRCVLFSRSFSAIVALKLGQIGAHQDVGELTVCIEDQLTGWIRTKILLGSVHPRFVWLPLASMSQPCPTRSEGLVISSQYGKLWVDGGLTHSRDLGTRGYMP